MRLPATLGLLLLAAGVRAEVPQLTQPIINTLTPIDTLPSSEQINQAFDDDPSVALATLIQLANPSAVVDRGVQLRALRALIHYCATPCTLADPAHQTLRAIEARYHEARAGSDLLMLRAALESLGVLRVPDDVFLLEAHLQHPSRDIRATTARALRDLGNTHAIPFLRARYADEEFDQVRLAISDALRVLGQPVP
ncbi:MAG: HEAT repeat domain-containing protein [Myxococcales bacterium]|nr:HEAT repeat domain-containing protein [Myxococcales bacterium]